MSKRTKVKKFKTYSKEWWREWRSDPLNYKRQLIKAAKWRAKKKGLPFDLSLDTVTWPERCPILDIQLVYASHKLDGRAAKHWHKASLDRIVPEMGYVTGNVRVVSSAANYMLGGRVPHNAKVEWLMAIDNFNGY